MSGTGQSSSRGFVDEGVPKDVLTGKIVTVGLAPARKI